jgi:hypothetical protein
VLPLADRGRDRTEDQHADDGESQTHVFLPIQLAPAEPPACDVPQRTKR